MFFQLFLGTRLQRNLLPLCNGVRCRNRCLLEPGVLHVLLGVTAVLAVVLVELCQRMRRFHWGVPQLLQQLELGPVLQQNVWLRIV